MLVTAGAELAPDTWDTAQALARDGRLDAVLVLRATAAAGAPEPLPAVDGVRVGYLGQLAAAKDPSAFHGNPPGSSDLAVLSTPAAPSADRNWPRTRTPRGRRRLDYGRQRPVRRGDGGLRRLPLFHVNALVLTLLAPLLQGQATLWAAAMSAVSTVYAALAQRPVDADISTLRYPVVGPPRYPPRSVTTSRPATGTTLVEGYGLTGATCASALNFPAVRRPGSVGQRLPYQRMRAARVAADGTPDDVPAGETGVLAISGPTVFPGYVVGRTADGYILDGRGKLVDDWLDTGDLARVDADCFGYLVGRAKDLIVRGGHNIDPAVLEDALLAHPQVKAASTVGRPDVRAGEVPVAYVTLALPPP